MIWLACLYFVIIALVGSLLLSAQLRESLWQKITGIFPALRQQVNIGYNKVLQRAQNVASQAPDEHQKWHQQQFLVILAGVFLLAAPVLWMATRDTTLPTFDEQSEISDPQIHALLEGEMLVPPPEVNADLIVAAETIARQAEQIQEPQTQTSAPTALPPAPSMVHPTELRFADRKWDKMNPRYVQRLLLVFKIMKERYGYDLVLLEGYRSPERQNRLANQGQLVTKATGYKSYHQFGLAGDVAFMRNGKVVITEKDPWAMRGYQLYGQVAESVGLVWGGRWTFMDLGHTEFRIKGILGNAEMARKLTSEGSKTIAELN